MMALQKFGLARRGFNGGNELSRRPKLGATLLGDESILIDHSCQSAFKFDPLIDNEVRSSLLFCNFRFLFQFVDQTNNTEEPAAFAQPDAM